MLSATSSDGAEQKRLIARGRQIAEELPTIAPDQTRAMLMALVSRVDIKADHVEIKICRRSLTTCFMRSRLNQPASRQVCKEIEDILTLKVKARLQRVGREMEAGAERRGPNGSRSWPASDHRSGARLPGASDAEPDLTVPAIASQERVTPGYMSRLLRLPSLAPDIVTAIINGKNPPQLSAKRLMRLALKIPTDWAEQRKLLGFHRR